MDKKEFLEKWVMNSGDIKNVITENFMFISMSNDLDELLRSDVQDAVACSEHKDKRFMAACYAMEGLLAKPDFKINVDVVTAKAYVFADALLKHEDE